MGTAGDAAPEPVAVFTLDELVAQHGWRSVYVLKLDLEGLDPVGLAGARASLARGVPRFVVFEYNSKWTEASPLAGPAGVSLANLTASLYAYDYLCYLVTGAGWLPLSGAWWAPPYETRRWSNVVCAQRGDAGLHVALLRANGRMPVPVGGECVEGGGRLRRQPLPLQPG